MALWAVGELPDDALAAAARFHAESLPEIEAALAKEGTSLVLAFPPADPVHRGWRLAAVQGLARKHAPLRVNGVESVEEAALSAANRYLDSAPGVTGQYWPLDAEGVEGP